MGPPADQLQDAGAPAPWFGDNDIIPLKEDVSTAPVSPGVAVEQSSVGNGAQGASAYPGDDAVQELRPEGDGPGDVYQGDVYQGDVYQGDVYQGEALSAADPGTSLVEEEPRGVPVRGMLFGIFAGVAAASIWYGLTVATGWHLGLVSWLIGIGVGIGVVAGTGRGGTDSALIAASITAVALLMGEFQIAKYYEAQEEAIYEQAETVERDGDYDDEEVAILAGMTAEDFAALSNNEKSLIRTLVLMADEDYADYDDPGDESGSGDSDSEDSAWQDESLTFGFFLGHLRLYLGWKGIIIWLIGVGAAFRIGAGKTA